MRFDDLETRQISYNSGRSIAHLLTADILWAFWYMKDTISDKFAFFWPLSSVLVCHVLCFAPLYSIGSCCTFYVPCMPWRNDIFTIFINELGYILGIIRQTVWWIGFSERLSGFLHFLKHCVTFCATIVYIIEMKYQLESKNLSLFLQNANVCHVG